MPPKAEIAAALKQARDRIGSGDYKGALECCKAALKLDSKNYNVYVFCLADSKPVLSSPFFLPLARGPQLRFHRQGGEPPRPEQGRAGDISARPTPGRVPGLVA